jgi:DNA replication protein DnaC
MKITTADHTSNPSQTEILSEQIECPRHGVYTAKVMYISFLDKKIYSKCPVCAQEDEEVLNARRAAQEIEERREAKLRLEARYKKMNIGLRYYDSSFDTFDAHTPELQKHLKTARFFADKPDGKLVMLGKNGNGKTHLAISILKQTGGVLYKSYEIGLMIRKTYEGGGSEYDFLEKLIDTPLLVIDELEKLKESEAKQNWLSYVIGKRYDNIKPLILIANCHLLEDCSENTKPCPKCLEYHLTADILSRITEDGIIMKFSGEDYRYKLGEEYLSRKRAEIAGGA